MMLVIVEAPPLLGSRGWINTKRAQVRRTWWHKGISYKVPQASMDVLLGTRYLSVLGCLDPLGWFILVHVRG